MLGDSPLVIGFVLLLVVGMFGPRLWRQRDPRRCPQCQGLALDLAGGSENIVCKHCYTELVRSKDGRLRRKGTPS